MYLTKPSAQETFERRMEVFRLRMRGLTQSVISKELGVNRNTILRDCKWIKEHMREIAANADTFSEVGEAMAHLREIEQEALYHMADTENAHAKNNYLRTALEACDKRIRLMMDAGIIEKAAADVNVNFDFSKMSTEELMQKRDELAVRMRRLGGDATSAA
jgi:hypothetical protein